MKRFGFVSIALPFAFLLAAGCHGVQQQTPAVSIKAETPKAPVEMSFASDDGKSTLTSFRVAYAKRGATRQEQNPNFLGSWEEYQALKTSKDRLGDSDTLLLIFDIRGGAVSVGKDCAAVAQEGIEFPAIGFGSVKPATPNDQVEIQLLSGIAGFAGMYLSPSDNDKSRGPRIWAFPLPPASSHLTVKGIGGFSHINFDLN